MKQSKKPNGQSRTYISVDRRAADGALQISIGIEQPDGSSTGYRIAGPNYDGRGKTLLKHFVTDRDVREIVGYLTPETKPKLKYDKARRTIVADAATVANPAREAR